MPLTWEAENKFLSISCTVILTAPRCGMSHWPSMKAALQAACGCLSGRGHAGSSPQLKWAPCSPAPGQPLQHFRQKAAKRAAKPHGSCPQHSPTLPGSRAASLPGRLQHLPAPCFGRRARAGKRWTSSSACQCRWPTSGLRSHRRQHTADSRFLCAARSLPGNSPQSPRSWCEFKLHPGSRTRRQGLGAGLV